MRECEIGQKENKEAIKKALSSEKLQMTDSDEIVTSETDFETTVHLTHWHRITTKDGVTSVSAASDRSVTFD